MKNEKGAGAPISHAERVAGTIESFLIGNRGQEFTIRLIATFHTKKRLTGRPIECVNTFGK
jgi:hypothetical protein